VAELHELRLAFKHCRYALEPVADIAPRESARLLRRLRAAQDCIGDHRDTLLAEHWVKENESALGPALVAHLDAGLREREKALRRDAARRAERVLDAWQAWRSATRPVRKATTSGPA
jgi:CHAD domain-containing protein